MSEGPIDSAVAVIVDGIELLRMAGEQVCDVDSLVVVQQCEQLTRRLEHVSLETLGRLERRGTLSSLGLGGQVSGLASLLGCDQADARRKVKAADHVTERVGLDGQVLPPALAATAGLWDRGDISLRHVEVIAGLIDSPEVRRVPHLAEGIEQELAAVAPQYTPNELRRWGERLIRTLDQDGAAPDDDPEPRQPNELHVSPSRAGGGRLRGILDALTYDALMTALGGIVKPPKRGDDDPRTLAERRADGLGQLAMFSLNHDDTLATTGGARPHLNVIMTLDELEGRVREATLDYGGRISACHLRAIACDCGVIPVVMGGNGEPLDIGRISRIIPTAMRNAVIARDRGCAFPGCDMPPAWSEVHHIIPWAHHGETKIINLVMVCITHHHMLHEKSGWTVKIVNGQPEFSPPAWIDPTMTPRRKPPSLIA